MEKLGYQARQLIDECVSRAMKETYREIKSDEEDQRITNLARIFFYFYSVEIAIGESNSEQRE